MSETRLIIAENIHAYTHLGEPVEFVPLAAPKKEGLCPSCNKPISVTVKGDKGTCSECKMKISVAGFDVITLTKTTTKHMKKYGLFPSVSRMAHYGEMDFSLTKWAKNRLIQFVMDNYFADEKAWWSIINRDLVTYESEAADRGTDIHGWIQKVRQQSILLANDEAYDRVELPDDDVIQRCTCEIEQWIMDQGYDYTQSERAYCAPTIGLGGTIDLVGIRSNDAYVSDFKTKMNPDTFKKIKDGNKSILWGPTKQLAGYCMIHPSAPRKAYVIPISNEDGEVAVIELSEDDLRAGEKAIKDNTQAFFSNQRYDPRKMYIEGKCWSHSEIMEGKQDGI